MNGRCAGVVLLLLCAGMGRGQTATPDLIPADALGGIVVRNIEELQKKGDVLVKESGLNLGLRPSQVFVQIIGFLNLQKGIDPKGSGSVVLVSPAVIGAEIGLGNLDQYLVLALPIDDLDVMASNLGHAKGRLKPGKLTTNEKRSDFYGKVCYVKGKHIFIGNNEKAVMSVAKGRSAGAEVDAARRKMLARADLLIHLGTHAWGDMWKRILSDVEQGFSDLKDEDDRRTVKEIVESLGAVRFTLCAVRLDGGLSLSVMTVFPKEGAATVKKFLTALQAGEGALTLRGLPEGNVVAAMAARGDGTRNALIARVMIQHLMRNVLETQRLLGAGDRPALLSVFNEIWHRLRGSRLALYRTGDPLKLGLFGMVGIMESEDPGQFLDELRQLARLGSADGLDFTSEAGKKASQEQIEQLIKDLSNRRFQVRASAEAKLALAGEQVLPYLEKAIKSEDLETRRRAERVKGDIVSAVEQARKAALSGQLTRSIKPSFLFLEKTEKVEGLDVRMVGVKLPKQDAAFAPQFKALLGPDWNRVRLAIHGKQVVVLVGSDLELLQKALRNLKDDRPGLARAKVLDEQRKSVNPHRKVEIHASTAMALALATAMDLEQPGKLPPNPPLSSLSLTVETDRLQVDLWLPLVELRALGKASGW